MVTGYSFSKRLIVVPKDPFNKQWSTHILLFSFMHFFQGIIGNLLCRATGHVWLGRTCAVANCQQQQHQHGANVGCADGSNIILYLAFILDDTVGEWRQVRDLFLCIKTPHVMILDCRFICVKLVWFETSNERTCNDMREGPDGESLPVNTWKHRAP